MIRPLLLLCLLFIFSTISLSAQEADEIPDTVIAGIYMTSVHDIDFREKEYSLNLWLWLKYRRTEFNFMENLEIPMAKTFEKSYVTVDTLDDGTLHMLMKLQCVMKGTWRIQNFPFDLQKLRFAIENSKYDSRDLVFATDTAGSHYGTFFLYGWEKDTISITSEFRKYETNFGDPTLEDNSSEYSTFRVTLDVHRESGELFLKLFLGMYISFLIAYSAFFIHGDNIESRLALSVGSLFAVIGNKYIIDSSLPESTSFTLVDTLHGLTLFFIFTAIAASIRSYRMCCLGQKERSKSYDHRIAAVLTCLYVLVNAWFIYQAAFRQAD